LILIDSPVANMANIARALREVGAAAEITRDPAAVARAQKLVLPGVGSFGVAMQFLREAHIDEAIREAVTNGAFLLGICVGHQVLFDHSDEYGITRGLGLVRGAVQRFSGPMPVPQIAWNRVRARGPLFDGVENESFYFVNSYAARDARDEIAAADYNGAFTAAVQRGRVFGVQFHPEKSSHAGLRVLRNFAACN